MTDDEKEIQEFDQWYRNLRGKKINVNAFYYSLQQTWLERSRRDKKKIERLTKLVLFAEHNLRYIGGLGSNEVLRDIDQAREDGLI